MDEYIKREAAINRIKEYALDVYGINLDDPLQFAGHDLTENFCEGLYEATELVDAIPAADVSPVVRGKWVHITRYNEGERMIATCSHCRDRGEVRSIRTEFGIWKIDSPRCPNCGARMDGGIVDG